MSDAPRCDHTDCTAEAAREVRVESTGRRLALCEVHAAQWTAYEREHFAWAAKLREVVRAAWDAHVREHPKPPEPFTVRGEE